MADKKKEMPVFPENTTKETNLADLANEDSWFSIHLWKLDMAFLSEDVEP